jgi:hypothetical protein
MENGRGETRQRKKITLAILCAGKSPSQLLYFALTPLQ